MICAGPGTCVVGCEMFGVCHCGCGREAVVHNKANAARNYTRGMPGRYVHGHNPNSLSPVGRRQQVWRWAMGAPATDRPAEEFAWMLNLLEERHGSRLAVHRATNIGYRSLCRIAWHEGWIRRHTWERLEAAIEMAPTWPIREAAARARIPLASLPSHLNRAVFRQWVSYYEADEIVTALHLGNIRLLLARAYSQDRAPAKASA